jgi:hypothetical protein
MFHVEMVNSSFQLYRCGDPHNYIDVVPLAVGTLEDDDNPVALYLGYYD